MTTLNFIIYNVYAFHYCNYNFFNKIIFYFIDSTIFIIKRLFAEYLFTQIGLTATLVQLFSIQLKCSNLPVANFSRSGNDNHGNKQPFIVFCTFQYDQRSTWKPKLFLYVRCIVYNAISHCLSLICVLRTFKGKFVFFI